MSQMNCDILMKLITINHIANTSFTMWFLSALMLLWCRIRLALLAHN